MVELGKCHMCNNQAFVAMLATVETPNPDNPKQLITGDIKIEYCAVHLLKFAKKVMRKYKNMHKKGIMKIGS